MEIWEDDGWASGNDDFVADAYYDQWRTGTGIYNDWDNYTWNSWQPNGNIFYYLLPPGDSSQPGNSLSIVDGILGGGDFDTMLITFSRVFK